MACYLLHMLTNLEHAAAGNKNKIFLKLPSIIFIFIKYTYVIFQLQFYKLVYLTIMRVPTSYCDTSRQTCRALRVSQKPEKENAFGWRFNRKIFRFVYSSARVELACVTGPVYELYE